MTDYDKALRKLHEQRAQADYQVQKLTKHAGFWADTRAVIEGEILDVAAKKIDAQKLVEQRRPAEPPPMSGSAPNVIRFSKRGGTDGAAGNFTYHYAAIRASRGRWTITQTPSAPRQQHAMDWGQLLTFIGTDNWHTIERFDAAEKLDLAAPETVGELTINHIGWAWLDADGDRWEYREGEWKWRRQGYRTWRKASNIAPPLSVSPPYTRVDA